MPGINKVILIGHLGEDPEVRQLTGNVSVTTFPFAIVETRFENGQKIQHTEWHNIVMWRNLAEVAGKILRKGSVAHLEGKIRTNSFTDSAGTIKYTAEIVIEQFTLLGRKSDFAGDHSTE